MDRLIAAAVCALSMLVSQPGTAGQRWFGPLFKECSLGPNDTCGMDVKCPDPIPYVVSGGGGMPEVSRDAHDVAMTMNVPISANVWRVQWRNQGTGVPVKVKVMVRVLCSDDASMWRE